jgi:hypothetical protein
MKLQTFFSVLFILCMLFFLPFIINAQPGSPGGQPTPIEEVPFDGGLSLVIAAGAGYAIKKKYDKRRIEQAQKKEIESNQ